MVEPLTYLLQIFYEVSDLHSLTPIQFQDLTTACSSTYVRIYAPTFTAYTPTFCLHAPSILCVHLTICLHAPSILHTLTHHMMEVCICVQCVCSYGNSNGINMMYFFISIKCGRVSTRQLPYLLVSQMLHTHTHTHHRCTIFTAISHVNNYTIQYLNMQTVFKPSSCACV